MEFWVEFHLHVFCRQESLSTAETNTPKYLRNEAGNTAQVAYQLTLPGWIYSTSSASSDTEL